MGSNTLLIHLIGLFKTWITDLHVIGTSSRIATQNLSFDITQKMIIILQITIYGANNTQIWPPIKSKPRMQNPTETSLRWSFEGLHLFMLLGRFQMQNLMTWVILFDSSEVTSQRLNTSDIWLQHELPWYQLFVVQSPYCSLLSLLLPCWALAMKCDYRVSN